MNIVFDLLNIANYFSSELSLDDHIILHMFEPLSNPDKDIPEAEILLKTGDINLKNYDVDNGKRGEELGDWTFHADIYASIEVSNLKISFNALKVNVFGLESMDKTINHIANKVVIPELLQKLQGLKLPLLGPDIVQLKDLEAQIANVLIQDNRVAVYSDVKYKGHASRPTDTNPPKLFPTQSYAAISAGIRSDGINTILQAANLDLSGEEGVSIPIGLDFPLESVAFVKIRSVDLSLLGSAATPVINIENGNGTFSTLIRAQAKVTINYSTRNRIFSWADYSKTLSLNAVPLPLDSIPVTIKKNSTGNAIVLTETIPKFTFNFGSDWPCPFSYVGDMINNGLAKLTDQLRDVINSKIPEKELFTLDIEGYAIPFTNLTAKFEFEKFETYGNSLSTIVKLTN